MAMSKRLAEKSAEKTERLAPIEPIVQLSPLSHTYVGSGGSIQVGDIHLTGTHNTYNYSTDPALLAETLQRLSLLQQTVSTLVPPSRCQTFQFPPENIRRIPRPGLLRRLAEALKAQCGMVVSQQGVIGLGGVGKTQLVEAYVQAAKKHQAIDDIPVQYDYIFWLHAEISLGIQFQTLAEKYCNLHGCAVIEAIQSVYAFLRGKSTLIVFDNVEEPQSLSAYLPPRDYQSSLHLLITSRNPHWGAVPTLELEGFTLEETATFIEKILVDLQNSEEIKALHTTLGNRTAHGEILVLPLALSHALSFIKAGHCTLAGYPELFNRGADPILGTAEFIDDPHPKTVGTTITLSLAQARLKAPIVEHLLCLTAYLAPENIPVTLLHENLPEETMESVQQGVEILAAYSLVTYDAVVGSVNVHRLVQATLRRSALYASICKSQLASLMDSLRPHLKYEEKDTVSLTTVRVYLSHVLMCAHLVKELTDFTDFTRLINLLRIAGEITLYSIVDASQAKNIYEDIHHLWEKLGLAENSSLASVLESLGNAYGELGNVEKSRALIERALSIYEREHGSQHFTVGSALTNLGNAYYMAGDSRQSEFFLRRAMSVFTEPDPTAYLGWRAIVLMNLSNVLDDLPKKKEMLEEVLKIQINRYDAEDPEHPKHPRVAITLVNLGNVEGRLGDIPRQKALLEQALTILRARYSSSHPIVARVLMNLANISNDMNHQKNLLEETLTIQESYCGREHPETAVCLFNLSIVCLDLGHAFVSEAYEYAQRAYTIFEKNYGLAHNYTLNAKTLLKCCQEVQDFRVLTSGITMQSRDRILQEKSQHISFLGMEGMTASVTPSVITQVMEPSVSSIRAFATLSATVTAVPSGGSYYHFDFPRDRILEALQPRSLRASQSPDAFFSHSSSERAALPQPDASSPEVARPVGSQRARPATGIEEINSDDLSISSSSSPS